VLCCGYHGWHDWYIAVTDRNRGIPQAVQDLSFTFNYNDIQSVVDSIDDDVACVILEPMVFEEPKDNFLQRLRDVCTRHGIVLIFDEMWTGFRLALGGAQQHFGVNADLMCYSKAVANGMPISILAGRREIMQLCEKEIFFFTTFGGEALSLAATKATILELREKRVPDALARQGRKLKDGYKDIARQLAMTYTSCGGMDCRTIVTFDASAGNPLEMKSLVQQEMIRRGVLWGGYHNMSYSHTDEDIIHTLTAYREVLPILKRAVEDKNILSYLRGEPVEPVFRRSGKRAG
jgi:glutamate-1-semialdehyde aminotransferase